MITTYEYFYDAQIRRFLEQIVRAFSGFQYMTGRRGDKEPQLLQVPCRLADPNAMAGSIIRNNSENTLNVAPMITVWLSGMQPMMDRVQSPSHVSKLTVWERAVDPVTGKYTNEPGNKYQVERIMPRPLLLKIQVDIWTTTLDQKFQLFEQIYPIFFPTIDVQNSESALDWTARTQMLFEDLSWTSRSMPIGTNNDTDIMTLGFSIPMWITVPARVTNQTLIEKIFANVGMTSDPADLEENDLSGFATTQIVITPGDNWLRVGSGTVQLLGSGDNTLEDGEAPLWNDLFTQYRGALRPAQSTIEVTLGNVVDGGTVVSGVLQADANDPTSLFWQIDPTTLPANTMTPVDALIDPTVNYPGVNGVPSAINGRRFLLLHAISSSPTYWGTLSANENDIVEYQNGAWGVVFASSQVMSPQYVLNRYANTQLRWTGSEWVSAINGDYGPAMWRLIL